MLSFAMANVAKNLARNLKARRGDETQRAFALKLGIKQPHLNRIEQCKENITLKTIQKLCDNLKCSVGDLFKGEK